MSDKGQSPSERTSSKRDERQDDEDGSEVQQRQPVDNKRRSRSRSPDKTKGTDKPRRHDAGFKWKIRRRDDDERQGREEGLKRGYRDHYRPRSRSRSPQRAKGAPEDYRERRRDRNEDTQKKAKKEKKPTPAAAPQQEMIIVYVNDRLGTKKAIPCFPTDPIKDFKIIVASMIGRKPHEILLKRQGERPFKDMLTLQDYGVSNNVQLDLEVDTGD